MAFCRYCGRELKEGETCSCRGQNEAPKTSVGTLIGSSGTQVAGALWQTFLLLLKHPMSRSRSYMLSGNPVSALTFFVLHGICSGLFAVLCINKINSLIGLGGSLTENLQFSGAGAFFLTLLYSVLLSMILSALCFAGSKLFHGELGFQSALCVASMRSVISVPVSLLGCLFLLLNIPAGFLIFYGIGLLAGVSFLTAGIYGVGNIHPDRKIYFSLLVVVVFLLLFLLLASKAIFTYIPSSIRDLFSWETLVSYLS